MRIITSRKKKWNAFADSSFDHIIILEGKKKKKDLVKPIHAGKFLENNKRK